MRPKKLYFFFLGLSLIGFLWIFINAFLQADIPVCLFKRLTGIPCPSCGITGTIESVLHGDFNHISQFNLLGIIVLPLILIFPLWIIMDLLFHKTSFYYFYLSAEKILRKKQVAIPMIALVIINWAWNIYQHFAQ